MSQNTGDILSLIFGTISVIMAIGIELPQLYSIIKTKNTSGTSLTTYILFMVSSVLWITWAILYYLAHVVEPDVDMSDLHIASLVPALVSNTINLCLVAAILFLKCRNLRICKKQNVTELELSKIIFDKQVNYSWIRKYLSLIIVSVATVIVVLGVVIGLLLGFTPHEVPQSEFDKYTKYILGFNIAAAVFFELISWPQFFKCMKYKDTSGISLFWAIFFPLSCFICFGYDLMLAISTNDFLSVLASLICNGMIINTLVLILKVRNMKKAKKLGLSEWAYTKKYIDKKQKSK